MNSQHLTIKSPETESKKPPNELYLIWKAHKMIFPNVLKVKANVKSLSHVRLFVTPWTIAYMLLRPWDFLGKSTGVGCLSPGDLPDPGIKLGSPAL